MSERIRCSCGVPVGKTATCSECMIAAAEKITDLERQLDEAHVERVATKEAWLHTRNDRYDDGEKFAKIVDQLRTRIARMEEAVKKESPRALETIQEVQKACLISGDETNIIVRALMTTLSCTIGRLLRDALPGGDDDGKDE